MYKKIVTIAVAIAFFLMATACGNQNYDQDVQDEYVPVCVDPATEVRLDEDACDSTDSDYLSTAVFWYMLTSSSHSYPRVGGKAKKSYFETVKPKKASIAKNPLPAKGGKSVGKTTGKAPSTSKPKTNSGSTTKKSGGWGGSNKSSGGGSSYKPKR